MPKLKPLSKAEELSAIPVDEPVLVELEPVASGAEPDDRAEDAREKPGETEQPDPDAGAKVLQTQMEDMRKANEARELTLQRERDEARREAREASARAADTETDLISNALQAAQESVKSAKAALKLAIETGDADGQADAQERIGRAAADVREYERAAAVQASEREREKAAPQPQQQRPTDIDGVLQNMPTLMPTERDWLKAHPDAIMDAGRNKELDVAYIKATRSGLIRGTPSYFSFIEKEMGYQAARTDNDDDADERTAMPAAPVSREARSSATGRVNNSRIELSPAEREQAKLMGITDIAYAQGKRQMIEEKRMYPEKFAARS